MHPAWQFSVSFTCAANGLIVDGRSLLENWLPNHIRVRYRPRKDIRFSTYTMPCYWRILFLRKGRSPAVTNVITMKSAYSLVTVPHTERHQGGNGVATPQP